MFWPLFLLAATLIIPFSLATSAIAHMPPPPHLIRLMMDALGNARAIELSGKLVIFPDRLVGPETAMDETQRFYFPDRFRSDIQSGEVKRLHVINGYEHVTAIDGRVLPSGDSPYDVYKDILLYRDPGLLEERLAALGINLQVVSLGRFLDKFVLVIGALYPDESVSQLWLDRSTFLPQRLMVSTARTGGAPLDIHYTRWHETMKNWYPMRIEFYEDGLLSREVVVESLKVHSSMDASWFDVRTIKKQLTASASASGNTPEPQSDDVKAAIEAFRKRFEP